MHVYSHVCISLRLDEIKLWLTPSGKQRRNPWSGLPAVYPDFSMHHDWPVKKTFVLFVAIVFDWLREFPMGFTMEANRRSRKANVKENGRGLQREVERSL